MKTLLGLAVTGLVATGSLGTLAVQHFTQPTQVVQAAQQPYAQAFAPQYPLVAQPVYYPAPQPEVIQPSAAPRRRFATDTVRTVSAAPRTIRQQRSLKKSALIVGAGAGTGAAIGALAGGGRGAGIGALAGGAAGFIYDRLTHNKVTTY